MKSQQDAVGSAAVWEGGIADYLPTLDGRADMCMLCNCNQCMGVISVAGAARGNLNAIKHIMHHQWMVG
jgi:hypothetical protein